jgi:hypothetical protein
LDFEFNEVEENDDINNIDELKAAPDVNPSEAKPIIDKIDPIDENKLTLNKEDEDDDFDFVEEGVNTDNVNKTNTIEKTEVDKISSKNKNDDFEFVEESEDFSNSNLNEVNNISNLSNQTKSTPTTEIKSNLTKFLGRNSEKIKNLVSEYKSKYLKEHKSLSQFEEIKVSSENISTFHLQIEKSNISMQQFIQSINYFKTESEIALRSVQADDVISMSLNLDSFKNIRKNNKFNDALLEFSNTTVKNLYFKYIDLKRIYNNTMTVSNQESSSPDIIKEITKEDLSDNFTISLTENKTDKTDKTANNDEIEKSNQEPNNSKSKELENTPSNPIIGLTLDQAIESPFDFRDFTVTKAPVEKETKIEIDSALFSIVLSETTTKVANNAENPDAEKEEKGETEEKYDESKILDLLKNMTKNKESQEIIKPYSDEEKNNEEFSKILNELPNYNFLLSKFVEYPDSLFNI